MGSLFSTLSNSVILDLSTRAIVGSALALLILLLLTVLFRKNKQLQQILFILVLGVILFTSALLFATAMVHMQDTAANCLLGGVLKL